MYFPLQRTTLTKFTTQEPKPHF